MTRPDVEGVLACLPDELRATMVAMVGAPCDVVVAVFQLLPDDQRDAAVAAGLAQEGRILDADAGVHDLRPTQLAEELISTLGYQASSPERVSIQDLHARAERLARALADDSEQDTTRVGSHFRQAGRSVTTAPVPVRRR